jgi:L-lactate dehydrogenase complex protein LldG
VCLAKVRQKPMRVPSGRRGAPQQRSPPAGRSTPKGVIPASGKLPKAGQVDLFCAMAEQFGATLTRVSDYKDVPAEVSAYLRARQPAGRNPHGRRQAAEERPDGHLEKNLEVRRGASDGADLAGVSHAMAGIAETGTLALTSGPDNPTTINFLPEHHIVVVKASATSRATWKASGPCCAKKWARARCHVRFNLVTGPSRSGDIEQTIILGAHGPRALHVIVVE